MVVIIDYGMGNIRSIQNALNYLGIESIVTAVKEEILNAQHLILPGVGSFYRAMSIITSTDLDSILRRAVVEQKIPILGICLGMQLLGKSSTEDGCRQGLGFVDLEVDKFNVVGGIKIPHVGFNTVNVNNSSPIYNKFGPSADFYFTHSYRMLKQDNSSINGTCEYGETFVASFQDGHICGTQFHPEKSHSNGLKLLRNFIENV